MFSGQFYEKRLPVRERSMKFLLETVTYIATKERVTCIIEIPIETVMYIIHCAKYHVHNCNRDSHLHKTIKIVTHIFARETVTCICAAETSICVIATETVTCIIATERSTNIPETESSSSKPAKWQQTSPA